MSQPDKTLLLIDSHALIHRAFHAFPASLTVKGQSVNAVYGYSKLLLDVIWKFKPSHVVAVFDAPGATVRHTDYGAYKANRSKPDDELISQIPLVEQFLEAMDIPMLRLPGYEADDIIGTIDLRHSGKWARTIVVTGDRDLFQLVDEDTFVYLAGSAFSASKLYDIEGVEEKMGVKPEFIVDLKALMGDASDNIPGVAGIGAKSAVDLVTQFGHIENLYDRIKDVPNKYKNKLEANAEMAVLSKKLATIICDAPVSFDFDKAPFGTYDSGKVKQFFQQYEFRSVFPSLEKVLAFYSSTEEKPATAKQSSLSLQLPFTDFPLWNGEEVKEEIFLLGNYLKTGDPLSWSATELLILIDAKVLSLPVAKVGEFMQKNKGKWIVTVDGKALIHTLLNMNIELIPRIYDMCISTYLCTDGQSKQDLLGVLTAYDQDYGEDWVARLQNFRTAYSLQKEKVGPLQKLQKLIDLELKLVPVIVQMERAGIVLDKSKLADFSGKLIDGIADLEQQIYSDVGHEFNIASPKQVGEVLFDEKGLPSRKKTKTGAHTTDERTLLELIDADPVIRKILDYRELSKLLSTYVRPLPELINPRTGRIHPIFNQLGALTGRFSSQNPNVQNIPVGEVAGVNMRETFTSGKNSILVSFDYSQQELRLLAELSGEENMQEAFSKGEDIHARTAADIFNVDIKDVDKAQRRIGKTMNFGIVYGMSAFGFADRMKVDPKSAAEFIQKYFAKYPKVQEYYDQLIKKAKEDGYVETIMGRRRNSEGLNAPNYQLREAVKREVMNFPLQGSAADVIKAAMIKVPQVMKEFPAKMLLQVHDELIFEYESDKTEAELLKDEKFLDFVRKIRETMLEVVKLKVPLEVGAKMGKSWGAMEEIV